MMNGICLGIAWATRTKPTSPMTLILPHRTALRTITILGWLICPLLIQCLLPDLIPRGQSGLRQIIQWARQPLAASGHTIMLLGTLTPIHSRLPRWSLTIMLLSILTPLHSCLLTWRSRWSTPLTNHPQHTGPRPHRLRTPILRHRLVGLNSGPVLGMTAVFIGGTCLLTIWEATRLRDHTMTTL